MQKTLINGKKQIFFVTPGDNNNNENLDTNNLQAGQNLPSTINEDFKERLIHYVHERAAL